MTSDPIFVDLRKRLEFSERRRLQLTRAQSRNSSEEDGLLWSVADLMTLLLIFFVVFHGNQIRGATQESTPEPAQI
ncbi:MAG: flagellar motor protein MotB, partial [Desulfobacterales bacterium]